MSFKLYNARYSAEFFQLIEFTADLFRLNLKTKSNKRQELFKIFSTCNHYLVRTGTLAYSCTIFLFLAYPVGIFCIEGKREPIIALYIPGIDETTLNGYLISTCYQAILAVLASFALAAVDIFYAILLLNVPIQSRLIEIECLDLNKLLKVDEKKKKHKKRPHIWKQRFRNILLMHLEAKKYVSKIEIILIADFNAILFFSYITDIDGIFFKISFVQITTATFNTVLMLYINLTVSTNLHQY